jgi:hypothetical protein
MGSAQAVFATNRMFSILSAGLIINGNGQQTAQGCGGAVGSSPTAALTTPTDCGIKIDNSSGGGTDGISDGGNAVNFTIKYVEYLGGGNATTENYLIRADNSPGATLQHMYIHRFGAVCVVVGGTSNFTFTDNYIFRNQVTLGGSPSHGQCLESFGDSGNMIVARNVFRDLSGTAIIMAWVGGGGTEAGPYKYYDNIIWNTPGYTPPFPAANGLLACINGFVCNNVTMSQNTIALMPSGAQTGIDSETGGTFTVQNNIWYSDAVIGDLITAGTLTSNRNSYLASGASCPSGTSNVCDNASANPFTASSTGDFTLASDAANWNNRISLASPFDLDAVGTTFTTDRGAFQFVSGSPVAPTVTSTAASSITTTTASAGGNVTSDGGASVTSRGTCYATTSNPTTPCTSDGTGTGIFSSSLTGLSSATLYHIRAFATNSVGTSYGSDLTFTTSSPAPPTASTTGKGFRLAPGAQVR